jgi:hypothetical protein
VQLHAPFGSASFHKVITSKIASPLNEGEHVKNIAIAIPFLD